MKLMKEVIRYKHKLLFLHYLLVSSYIQIHLKNFFKWIYIYSITTEKIYSVTKQLI